MFNKKIMILAGAGTGVVVLFGALFTFIVSGDNQQPNDLSLAVTLLEDHRWDVAGRIARDLEKSHAVDPDSDSAWNYVQGVSLAQSVNDRLNIPKNRQALWTAIEYLEKSQELGFPLGSKGRGQFYLGLCYFNTYQWSKAAAMLTASVNNWPQQRSSALRMAIRAALRQQPPDIATARKSLDAWQAIPGLSAEELASIHLSEAEFAFATMDTDKCESELLKVEPSLVARAEADLMRGRWRLEIATTAPSSQGINRERLATAAELFRKTIHSLHSTDDQRRQANYFLGRTLRSQKKLAEAIGTLNGVRQRDPQSAEAIAAGMEEAEILLESGKLEACVETARHVLRDMGNVKLYNEQWVTIEQLRTRLLNLGRQLRDKGNFQLAINLAGYLPPVFPPADAVRLQAETFQQWAELAGAGEPKSGPEKAAHREKMHQRYLLAGEKFEELSRLEMRSAEYPSIAWQAIQCYQNANDLNAANRLLIDYLRYEERTKLPRGFLALGQNYLNSGEWQKATIPLDRCLKEYPDHPISYAARLLTARAYCELNRLEEAIELLLQNIRDGNLEPTSEAWRDSLFQLGQTVFRRADRLILEAELMPPSDWTSISKKLEESHKVFLEASQELNEAAMRWKEDPRYFETRYLICKSQRMGAEYPTRLINSKQVTVESVRRQLLQQRRALLETALDEFQALHTELTAKQEVEGLTDQDKSILRNSYFGEADALFELGRYEEAILAYRNVGNRFLNQPEALEALIQIAQCQRRLGQNEMAKRTLVQAEQVLKRIPADFDPKFPLLTRSSRADWQQLIAWMQTW
jgi:TolA-binding protein